VEFEKEASTLSVFLHNAKRLENLEACMEAGRDRILSPSPIRPNKNPRPSPSGVELDNRIEPL